MTEERRAEIARAIRILDRAPKGQLWAILSKTNIHQHLKEDPAALRKALAETPEDADFGAWKGAQQIIQASPPWASAEIREGVVPEQAMLYPRPVVLECGECGASGFWYPDEDKIAVRSIRCWREGTGWRTGHEWSVALWNGHEPR